MPTETPGVRFKLVNATQEAEDAYDVVAERNLPKPSGVIVSITAIVKGALGSGILSAPFAYSKAGYLFALPVNIVLGVYMTYCLYVLGVNGRIMCKRTGKPFLTYPEVGEAAMNCFPNPKVARWGRTFGNIITTVIAGELFGACSTYQLIIAKTIKQLVEDQQVQTMAPAYEGYPSIKVYLAIMIIPIILICWLRHLQWLAPFTICANMVVLMCVLVTIYYSMDENPSFSGMETYLGFSGGFRFIGMIVFSMSCAGITVSIENNMKDPDKFPFVLCVGMAFIVLGISATGFFGYNAYLDKITAPVTVNFPMTLAPKILKGTIAVMIYVTHALNFFVPFMLIFNKLKTYHKPERHVFWEYFYRALFVSIIFVVALVFPSISDLMGFLGAFCISNMAFIFPNIIYLLVNWERPGLGKMMWRLWKTIFLLVIGIFLWFCGTAVSISSLVKVFQGEGGN